MLDTEGRFLFIFEDGVMRQHNKIQNDDVLMVNDGTLDVINLDTGEALWVDELKVEWVSIASIDEVGV